MHDDTSTDKRERILEAVLAVLARDGISGVTMRAVAREAEVALGLATYYFEDKDGLVAAALERIADSDAALVEPTPGAEPGEALRVALHRIADPDFLSVPYLALRLQLWSLAGVDERYAAINQAAQRRYLTGLVALLAAAHRLRTRASPHRHRRIATVVRRASSPSRSASRCSTCCACATRRRAASRSPARRTAAGCSRSRTSPRPSRLPHS